jgi:FlaA1/EpsC-like NDP-sugar epimerase
MKDYFFLLNRPEWNCFPVEKIDAYFQHRRVLVTGAGGTIGSEICKRLAPISAFLGCLGHSELPIFRLRDDPGMRGSGAEFYIADVRRPLDEIFIKWKPDVVIHAAAHKHVGLLEGQPLEAYVNNVGGTINVAAAAQRAGVEKFVFISTDKAAQPTSVMGKSKRLAELWLLAKYKSAGIARFGNVLGSSGSLVEILEKRIAEGKFIELTHPGMERWFITAREAVGLVLSAAISDPGIYSLDMGDPVNILELTEKLLAQRNSKAGIVFTNPGSGEKMTEHLLNPGEEIVGSPIPGVLRIETPAKTEVDFEAFRCEHFA